MTSVSSRDVGRSRPASPVTFGAVGTTSDSGEGAKGRRCLRRSRAPQTAGRRGQRDFPRAARRQRELVLCRGHKPLVRLAKSGGPSLGAGGATCVNRRQCGNAGRMRSLGDDCRLGSCSTRCTSPIQVSFQTTKEATLTFQVMPPQRETRHAVRSRARGKNALDKASQPSSPAEPACHLGRGGSRNRWWTFCQQCWQDRQSRFGRVNRGLGEFFRLGGICRKSGSCRLR